MSIETDFRRMFDECKHLKSLETLSKWYPFEAMFNECKHLKGLEGLTKWNISNETDETDPEGDSSNGGYDNGLTDWEYE